MLDYLYGNLVLIFTSTDTEKDLDSQSIYKLTELKDLFVLVCVETLRPSQSIGVMSSTLNLSNLT